MNTYLLACLQYTYSITSLVHLLTHTYIHTASNRRSKRKRQTCLEIRLIRCECAWMDWKSRYVRSFHGARLLLLLSTRGSRCIVVLVYCAGAVLLYCCTAGVTLCLYFHTIVIAFMHSYHFFHQYHCFRWFVGGFILFLQSSHDLSRLRAYSIAMLYVIKGLTQALITRMLIDNLLYSERR